MNNQALPHKIGVLGGGRMGAGIAHSFLINGSNVIIIERDDDSARAARERVISSVARTIARNGRGVLEEISSRLTTCTDYGSLVDREIVVEAVPEVWDLKISSLRKVEKFTIPGTLLASNTSSLSVTGLAQSLTRPKDFIGLHFFNPVPRSNLIEIVVGRQTGSDRLKQAKDLVVGLGKNAVVVQDAPGFASSRLGLTIALEAMRMLEEGVATAEDIDTAMVLGYKHSVGPLRTTDIVGLDVRLSIAEYLHKTLGERFAPPQILKEKVESGELGRKSGKGFFDWD